jgi:hypothetical protein
MSHVVLNYGWFGWNNMPAWIASIDGRPLKQCRIVDLDGDHAKLEVDRAYEIPDHFLLQLSAFSRSAFQCKVLARQGMLIHIEFKRSSLFERPNPPDAKPETTTSGNSRHNLRTLRGLAKRRHTHRSAIRSALVVAGVASFLIALAVILDWARFQPSGYELAGSTSSFFRKAPSESRTSTVGH